jgi:hypothetical protein
MSRHNEGSDKDQAGEEEYDTADKSEDAAALHSRGSEETGTHYKKNSAPKMKLPFPLLAITHRALL